MIAEYFQFYRQTQPEGESVAEYIVALKELLTYCDLETSLNNALRDCLICGLIIKEAIQKILLTEAELRLKKACEIAQVMEVVDKNASELKSEETKSSINVQKKPPGESKKSHRKRQLLGERYWYHCGGSHSMKFYIHYYLNIKLYIDLYIYLYLFRGTNQPVEVPAAVEVPALSFL